MTPRTGRPLVSAVVPAFNAERTIAETLDSVIAQTYPELEIIVVDDGSTDSTARAVERVDPGRRKLRLLKQKNAGVAAARNAGIDAASGDFIAPIDADDIWHPEKIERQMAAMTDKPDSGFVYTWFRPIDSASRVIGPCAHPLVEGRAFHRHLAWNFVSNGSSVLVPARLAKSLRYDASLHEAGVGGCEDYLFQLEIARRRPVSCVRGFLTGYRRHGGTLSGNPLRMARSHVAVLSRFDKDASAEERQIIQDRIARFQMDIARYHLRRLRLKDGLAALSLAFMRSPRAALRRAAEFPKEATRHAQRVPGELFKDSDPSRTEDWRPGLALKYLAMLEALDQRKASKLLPGAV